MEGGLIGEIFIYKTDYRGIYYYKVSNLQLRYYWIFVLSSTFSVDFFHALENLALVGFFRMIGIKFIA